jgi:hypothetical protein
LFCVMPVVMVLRQERVARISMGRWMRLRGPAPWPGVTQGRYLGGDEPFLGTNEAVVGLGQGERLYWGERGDD